MAGHMTTMSATQWHELLVFHTSNDVVAWFTTELHCAVANTFYGPFLKLLDPRSLAICSPER